MLDFFKPKKQPSASSPSTLNGSNVNDPVNRSAGSTKGLFSRLKQGLSRTRQVFATRFKDLFLGKKTIDKELLEELEDFLLSADVGLESTEQIMTDLSQRLKRSELKDPEALLKALKSDLNQLLKPIEVALTIPEETKPFVILVVGINGAGKTTTIGKLAKNIQSQGKKVMLAAGDTFRAAAIEQLQIWGERNQLPVVAQQTGADSASVIFDAFQAAKSRQIDVLIADTAGRLHTQDTLMEELKKIVRVMRKLDEKAPHEILLVLDAGIGQNALVQTKKFHEALGISGLTLTKLDGTAKGGIIFNIAKTFNIPIRFIGLGEGIDDLKPFEAAPFVDALFMVEDVQNTNTN